MASINGKEVLFSTEVNLVEGGAIDTSGLATKAELREVESIAKGANQAICFDNYDQMVEHFRNAPAHKYNNGQNIMIVDLNVPDLWVSLAFNESDYYSFYDYQIEDIAKDVIEYGFIYIGHYRLSALETQKVDLAEYVTTEELAVEATACNAYAEGLVRNLDNYVEENFAKKEALDALSDEFSQVLTELHAYAEALKGGEVQ